MPRASLANRAALELVSLLRGLVSKMSKASNSLVMHGALKRVREAAALFLKANKDLVEEAPAAEALRLNLACLDLIFGGEDEWLTPIEARNKAVTQFLINGDVRKGRMQHHTLESLLTAEELATVDEVCTSAQTHSLRMLSAVSATSTDVTDLPFRHACLLGGARMHAMFD